MITVPGLALITAFVESTGYTVQPTRLLIVGCVTGQLAEEYIATVKVSAWANKLSEYVALVAPGTRMPFLNH
jgi:hypothetical protein